MKNIMIVALLLAGMFAANAQAPQQPSQGQGDKGERIEALRIAFITQQLSLTPTEAQKFWPIYNQFNAEMKTLRQNFKMDANGQLTAEQQLDFEQKKLDLKKKYKSQYEAAIGKDKVNQLYNLEKQFHDKLKEMRDQRQQNGNEPRGGGKQGGRF